MLVIVAVVIVAALAGAALYILSTQPPPTPPGPTLSSVTVTTTPRSTLNQTEVVVLTAAAVDTTGRDQTSNATWAWSASPASAVTITVTALAHRATVRGLQAGTVTLTAQATLGSSQRSGSSALTIEGLRFEVARQGPVAAVGEPFDITVAVVTVSTGASVPGYDGTVHLTSTDSSAVLPPDGPLISGSRIFSVRFGTPGLQTVTATDTLATTITGSVQARADRRPVADFTIAPDPADRRIVTFTSTSTDPDGDAISAYDWEFGDGTTGSIAVVTHTYTVTGQVTINLTVTDQFGLPSSPASQAYTPTEPPVAFFEVNGTLLVAPDIRVYVNATQSTGTIQTYNWTWDDGTQSEFAIPTAFHDYGPAYADQVVDITLNVTDVNGVWDNVTVQVTVTVAPLPPVASFEITSEDNVTLQVVVDGSASTDPNGNIATFAWNWGDGNTLTKDYGPGNLTASWQYAAEGDYTITLTVTDTTGLFSTDSKTVSLFRPELPPEAAFTVAKMGFEVGVDASATTDPNGPADIVAYNWTWGDGTQSEFAIPTATHTYPTTDALRTITLAVRDTTGRVGTATRKLAVAASTLDYTYHNFLQVPYGDWWDFRGATYGDQPMGVTCFNETAALVYDRCAGGNVPLNQRTYFTAPPYTNWYPLPGNTNPGNPNNNPLVYGPYRMDVLGANVAGYNVSEPVFLPVVDYGAAPDAASYVDFHWRFNYATGADKAAIGDIPANGGCNAAGFDDGFDSLSTVTLSMDLAMSARLFGTDTSSVGAAQAWWQANADTDCSQTSPIDAQIDAWLEGLGGTSSSTGKYDIANAFEWYLDNWMVQVNATVDASGTTDVTFWIMSYGIEVLIARLFYWGNTSYADHWDDSTLARGWWGMELAWFEDFDFVGTLTPADMDFSLSTVMQYHFQHEALAESGGTLDQVNDIPVWSWRPFLTDYTNDFHPQTHPVSELDRYPTETFVHSTPGSPQYGLSLPYDYPPVSWSPQAGEEWHFRFPSGPVIFFDSRTATGAIPTEPFTNDPTVKAYIPVYSPFVYESERPAGFGEWDAANMTWDVYGPKATPPDDGSPGNYALDGTVQPKLVLRNETAGAVGRIESPQTGSLAGPAAILPGATPASLSFEPLQVIAPVATTRRKFV